MLLILMSALAGAAGAQAQAPTNPSPSPIVTITLADGTSVRGKLLNADRDHVTIQPTAAGQSTATQNVPWNNISKVSNGLTREQAHAQWKQQQLQHELCPTCTGDRVTDCPTCSGTGLDQEKMDQCRTCNGGGRVPCTNAKCDKGKVDCPKPCLKLSQGLWKKKDDGKMWRTFRGRGGTTTEVSEDHAGELVEIKDGVTTLAGKCPACNGTAKADCATCNGEQTVVCTKCRGVGATGPACPACKADPGKVKCAACEGKGLAQR
jgi:hypothetical protein